jgi:uncharacterized protein YdiU (UPF0061 family)
MINSSSDDVNAIETNAPFQFQNNFASLGGDFFALVSASPLNKPYLIATSRLMTQALGISKEFLAEEEFCAIFSGSHKIQSTQTLAAVYSGHQFGVWAGQLGDGRAMLLGDLSIEGKPERYEVQLKGAGPTPYSRMGDGRAVLRSSVREFLCSEAMAALNIPTSRALCITASDQYTMRERPEKTAIVTRLAHSFIRFGSFEHWYYNGNLENLKKLADFTIANYYPELSTHAMPYQALLLAVVERTADLIAYWQTVGFMHGVMNTDNMSILGITLDYGPFGFMEGYDPQHICNHSDTEGRYSFQMQPRVGQWNCHALAQALLPLIDDIESTQLALAAYVPRFESTYHAILQAKFGLIENREGDKELYEAFFDLMAKDQADYTLAFRNLSALLVDSVSSDSSDVGIRDLFIEHEALDTWLVKYRLRLKAENSEDQARKIRMNLINPKYILRNYLAQQAIEKAEQKDFTEIEKLLAILEKPYDEQIEHESYAKLPPDWARSLSVSCSS